jgi:hypothetical protein
MRLGPGARSKVRASGNTSGALQIRKHPRLDNDDLEHQAQDNLSKAIYLIRSSIGRDHTF